MVKRDLTFEMSATAKDAFERVEDKTAAAQSEYSPAISEYGSFVRECFGRLYRPLDAEERPLPQQRVEPWASKATTALEQQEAWPEARQLCRSHRVIAAETANNLALAVGAHLGLKNMPRNNAASADPVEMERRVRKLSRLHEKLQEAGEVEAAAEAEEAAKNVGKQWSESIARRIVVNDRAANLPLPQIGQLVTAATLKAKEMAEAVAVLTEAGVGRGPDGFDSEIPDDLVTMAARTKGINEVLRLLGKMREAYKKASMAPVGKGKLDVVGVTAGRDITKLVSTEMSRLGHPLMRLDVMRRAHEGQAMIREQRGEKEAERGDFVLLVDVSGSMGWGSAGPNIVYARAVAFAMLLRAMEEGRRVVLVMFDHGVRMKVVVERNGRNLAEAARALLCEPGGGTDAVAACKEARASLTPDERVRVDTCIVTDGEWEASAEDVAALRRSGGQFRAVLVGREARQHDWLDSSWRVDGTDPNSGALIMSELFSKDKR